MRKMKFTGGSVEKAVCFTEDGLYSGTEYKNLITGKIFVPKKQRSGIKIRIKSSRKKLFLKTTDMRLKEWDENGYTISGAAEGINIDIRVSFCEEHGVLKEEWGISSDGNFEIKYIEYMSFKRPDGYFRSAPRAKNTLISKYIARLGQPVFAGDLFFGSETPTGDNAAERGRVHFRYHTGRTLAGVRTSFNVYTAPPFVAGAGEKDDISAMRRAFYDYIDKYSKPLVQCVQYNSWYDNMLDITPENLIRSFGEVANGLNNAGCRAHIRYVADDGWTDYVGKGFWDFNEKFPCGFREVADFVSDIGARFGVWFGPRGGYTRETPIFAKRLEKEGYHMNRASRDVCTADPKYIKDICAKMLEFIDLYDVDYFKIDGFARSKCRAANHRHPAARGRGYAFYTILWERWTENFEKITEKRPDTVLNITSYAHCSPWFLKWADFVWMNNASDMGFTGKGSTFDRMLNYRDSRYYDLYVKRGYMFPAARIYNHEPCYALKNFDPAFPKEPVTFTDEEFFEYMRMCLMRGSALIELYFSPAKMSAEKWKIAADAINWARDNFDTLKNSLFFGGDAAKGEVYGYYASGAGKRFYIVRNPSDRVSGYDFTINGERIHGTLSPHEIRFSDSLY